MSNQRTLYPSFNLDRVAAHINTFTVNVHDYKLLNETVARVVLSYTGSLPSQEDVRAVIAKRFGQNASAIVASFRQLTKAGEVKSMVGFVKAAREVKPFEEAASNGGRYKAMASNLLMDKTDNTMWEIKSGATGKYLARQTQADLSELVHMACASVNGIPKFNQFAHAGVEAKEFAAFVDLESEEMGYGYIVASSEDGSSVTVIPHGSDKSMEISSEQLVEINDLEGEDEVIAGVKMAPEVAATKEAMIEYYKKAYSYSPEYIAKIIDIIDQHAVA